MFKVLVPSLAFLLVGCGSVDVTKHSKLMPLKEDAPVLVYHELPTFDFDVICEIKIKKTHPTASEIPKNYDEQLRIEARKCGADRALNTGSKDYATVTSGKITYLVNPTEKNDNKIHINGWAIKKISNEGKLSLGHIKKIASAVKMSNQKVLSSLLTQVDKNRDMRYSKDTLVLDLIYLTEASRGTKCRQDTLRILEGHEAKIEALEINVDESTKVVPNDLIFCGDVLKRNYYFSQDRLLMVKYVYSKMLEIFSDYVDGQRDLEKIKNFSNVLPETVKEINLACQKDETSETCIYRSEFSKTKSLLNVFQKNAKPQFKKLFHKMSDMLVI